MSEITVYTTGPTCVKCNLTKDALTKAGVEFVEVRLDQEPEIAAQLRKEGHAQAPFVRDTLTGDQWSDFRRDRLASSVNARKQLLSA